MRLGGDSQNFLGKFVRFFFVTLRCFYGVVIHRKSGVYILATFPPLEGGEKIGTFGSLGKKIDPSEKKKFNCKEKI